MKTQEKIEAEIKGLRIELKHQLSIAYCLQNQELINKIQIWIEALNSTLN